MGQAGNHLRRWSHEDRAGLIFFCPGCDSPHSILTEGEGAWGFNGNLEKPTFTPSVLVTYPANPDATEEHKEWRAERRCHSFVTDGQIAFLGDCTHALAGQTVALPELPPAYRDQ